MKLKINGEEYKASSVWTINEKVGNPTSSRFSVEVEGKDKPHAGDVVEFLTDDDNCIFFGLIGIPKSPAFYSEYQVFDYGINCINGNSILQRRIANVSYTNKTMTEIVTDLYERYIRTEGIELGTISEIENPVFEKYNCKNMNLLSVLNELAGYINAVWQITDQRVFNFVKIEDFPACSMPVTPENASFGELQWSEDAQNLRTNQIVDGAFITTDPQTEQFIVTAEWEGMTTIFPIIQQPSISINGIPVPSEQIGVVGYDSGDTNILFFWAYDSQEVVLNTKYTGSIAINEGDTVSIVYVGLTPIRYEVVNTEKVDEIAQKTGLSGYIDNVVVDSTIVTRQDAINKANALLLQYGEAKNSLRCVTDIHSLLSAGFLTEDIDLYRQWTFNLPNLGIEGEYVITEKTIEPLRYDEDGSIRITLTFSDRNYIQSYGEIISQIYQDVTKLSIRAEEIVIYDQNVYERLTLKEELESGEVIPLWVSPSTMQNGQIALPLGSIMPNLVAGGADWRQRWTIFVCTNDIGEICSPYLGEDQYLCTL